MYRFLILAGALLLLSTPTRAATPANARAGEVIVKVARGITLASDGRVGGGQASALAARFRAIGAHTTAPVDAVGHTYRVRVSSALGVDALSRALAATPGVVFAEPNYTRRALRTPNDEVLGQQWALRNIHAFEAWDLTTGDDVMIAILDTGVSAGHPDLKGKVLRGYDLINNDGDPSDDEGHGTYVAGVAAATGDNRIGIAGVCWGCKILPVKVLGRFGEGDDATIAQGIRYAVDNGARIISMSLGGPDDSQVLRDAVAYARDRNVLVIAASGNGQAEGNVPNYPAAYPDVLAVAAVGGADVVTGFSTTGDFVDLAAPGVGVWSTLWNARDGDTYGADNGTSAACPHVAGAAALVLSVRPELSAAQVKALLEASADDVGPTGRDASYGDGRLNLLRAVQMASDPNLQLEAQPAPAAPTPTSQAQFFAPVGPPSDGTAFFAETGHTLRGAFRDFWVQNGGLPVFGYPLSEEFIERGENGRDYLVQYFERTRFELHPENPAPYHVLLGRLGVASLERQGRDWFAFPKGSPRADCLFFANTGHNLCEPFLSAWRRYGLEFDGRRGTSEAESLALFGQPISGPQVEVLSDGQPHVVQWFERARFEEHDAGMLFGLLSDEYVRQQGWR